MRGNQIKICINARVELEEKEKGAMDLMTSALAFEIFETIAA